MLWHDFKKRKNARAVESLLANNVQDTVNLEALMVRDTGQSMATAHRQAPPLVEADCAGARRSASQGWFAHVPEGAGSSAYTSADNPGTMRPFGACRER